MNRRDFLKRIAAGAAAPTLARLASATQGGAASATLSKQPNILLIMADDLGYADLGFQGAADVLTPNLDRLVSFGLRCDNGYVSHPFCSPTRAGLLTGRYQQRFGHENNPAWLPDDPKIGLPLSQTTLAQALKSAGYVTGAVGKWHLGGHPTLHPLVRGFDEYYGILGGGHQYLPAKQGSAEYAIPIDRNRVSEEHKEYLTDAFGRESAAFVRRHAGEKPWFLYLAFNAPHTPLQATPQYLERVKGIADERRRTYAAMICALDDAVGATLAALRETGAEQNTLIFFLSDNGGPEVSGSRNAPLRGHKGNVYEGGIRVPFVVAWPGRLPKGGVYRQPVIQLDIFATALAAAGAKAPAGVQLDGVNLLPFLEGKQAGAPHERLFWRTGGGASYACRQGDWKWVKPARSQEAELYNLAEDISEKTNLAASRPEIASAMEKAVMQWNGELALPLFQSPPGGKKKAQKKAGKKNATRN